MGGDKESIRTFSQEIWRKGTCICMIIFENRVLNNWDVYWITLAQNTVRRWALVNTVFILKVPCGILWWSQLRVEQLIIRDSAPVN
jgi:hypothetical protein